MLYCIVWSRSVPIKERGLLEILKQSYTQTHYLTYNHSRKTFLLHHREAFRTIIHCTSFHFIFKSVFYDIIQFNNYL